MNSPVRNNTRVGTFTCLVVGGVAVLAYILRVVARLPAFGAAWGADDWVMTAAIVRRWCCEIKVLELMYSRWWSYHSRSAHTCVSSSDDEHS